jgi:hypothetical protein
MARDHRGVVERGLALKKAGNAILETIGGRAIHPINVKVGGFYRAPSRGELSRSCPRCARPSMTPSPPWAGSPDSTSRTSLMSHELLALVEPGRYAIDGGHPRTDRGLAFDVREFDTYVARSRFATRPRFTLVWSAEVATSPVRWRDTH